MAIKYKPINGWTKQGIIFHIQNNFKGKSIQGNACQYRGPHGKKCGVGLFIPDSLYRKEMDGLIDGTSPKGSTIQATDIESVLNLFPDIGPHMPLEIDALQQLQSRHDGVGRTDTRPDSAVLDDIIDFIINYVIDNERVIS